MPTKQETYDTIVAHLRKQGRKATDDHGMCCYRADDGLKCAVGCLIPDDLYDEGMEAMSVVGSPIYEIVCVRLDHDLQLCGDMQDVHDEWEVERWEIGFRGVAEAHNLTYTPPEN